jgi:hypothetical protein
MNKSDFDKASKQFWPKVSCGVGCWIWLGCLHHQGYGLLNVSGKTMKAHRVSYELHFGAIPTGMSVLHRCDNTSCVHPAHLFLGTQADNVKDMVQKGRARSKPQPAETNGMARLTWHEVKRIRLLASWGIPQIQIAQAVGASPMTVSRIVRNLAWKEAA